MDKESIKIPNGYFQGLELQKNPYYKNINSSSTRIEPINQNNNSIFNYIKTRLYNLKKMILG